MVLGANAASISTWNAGSHPIRRRCAIQSETHCQSWIADRPPGSAGRESPVAGPRSRRSQNSLTEDALLAMTSIAERIAQELSVRVAQVEAAVALLDDKASVPFIARYRKEATGGLDDTQLRALEERLAYLRDMEDRRAAILKSIDEQGKLTPELAASIAAAETKARLEDLYLPYKPRRRTRAQIAREAGLEPLAFRLLRDPAARSRNAGRGLRERRPRRAGSRRRARWRALDPDGVVVGGCRARRRPARAALGAR